MRASIVDQVRALKALPSPKDQRLLLQLADVSQQQVADELGVHRVTVARWLCGARRPRGDLLLRYVRLLDAIRSEVSA